MTSELEAAFATLNDEQRQAVETLDGPVLVVAGPGTGKTQLLSLRAANILRQRDVGPDNLLCLTFTDAGAEAMTRRLVGFLGREAYGITVSTFHSFASSLRSEYPQHFRRSAQAQPISNLQRSRLVDQLLRQLPISDALYRWAGIGSAHPHLKALLSFIQTFKRSGLTPEQFRATIAQNLDFFDFVADKTELLSLLATPLTGSKAAKFELTGQIEQLVAGLPALTPPSLQQPLVGTPGIYQPYGAYLQASFDASELIDEETGKTQGLQELKKRLFVKTDDGEIDFKDRTVCHASLSSLLIYERYQSYLAEHELYDFDDMILDAIEAIEHSPALKAALQERYHYIQLDEYQDTNGSQMRLVELLTEDVASPNILVVGDDDQAIMRFQGASVEYIHQFEQAYAGVKRVVLLTNYRSTAPLIELGQQVAHQIEKRSAASATEKQLRARPGREDPPQSFVATSFVTKELQYHALARAIRQRIDEGFLDGSAHPGEEIAVISRTHQPLRELIGPLKQAQIAFNYTYTTTVSQIPSLQTLLVLLDFVAKQARAHPGYADARLPELLVAPQFGLTASDYIGFYFEFDRQRLREGWLEALGQSSNPRLRKLQGWLLRLIEAALTGPVRALIHQAAQPLLAWHQQQADADPLTLVEFNYGIKALLDFVKGELGGADRGLGAPPLRLADITECFAEADRLGVVVDVSLPLQRERAITLTSAHSSKGLEYDLVYLMDSDDASWHTARGGGSTLLSGNMLFGTDKDEDDSRRLLFVALTRARSELELYSGPGGIVRELLDLPEGMIVERTGELALEEVAAQAEHSWKDDYRLDTAELQALAQPKLEGLKMSVSRLNKFVDYQPGATNTEEFVTSGLLDIPGEPSTSLEFGNAVHAFLEDYVARVLLAGDTSVGELAGRCRERIANLDFAATELEHLQQRFSGIEEVFLPRLQELLAMDGGGGNEGGADSRGGSGSPRLAIEGWVTGELDGIPLVGKCDLLLLDDATRSIHLFDYKTKASPPEKPSLSYIRQLQFYRLLVESSEQYKGWTLVSSRDLYVEPMRALGFELYEEEAFRTTDEQLEDLKLLVKAAWWHIQEGRFDTSAFESSELYAAVRPTGFNKDGSLKAADQRPVQEAYERWLITQWQAARA